MDDLYRENILDHYKRPRNYGRPERFDLEFEDTNPLCGDEQHVFIVLGEDGKVREVGFEGKGCAISTAATSMLTEELAGKSREDLLRLDKSEVLDLLGIEISATRMKCALLGLKSGDALGRPVEDVGDRQAREGGVGIDLRAVMHLVLDMHHEDPPAGERRAGVSIMSTRRVSQSRGVVFSRAT